MSLEDVTSDLATAYKAWKENEGQKNDLRDNFFKEVTEKVTGDLEEKYITVTAPTPEAVEEYVAKKYPRWSVEDLRPEGSADDLWEVILIERPEFKPYTFVNHSNGMVFTKQVSAGSIYVDDERLQQEDPDLYEKVTFVPEPERQLRDLEELDPELLAKLAEYLYEGKPQVKLAAPRKAKPEELG